MDETFFIISFIAVSFERHKTFYQNKIRYKLFLPTKFTFTKAFILLGHVYHIFLINLELYIFYKGKLRR